MSLDLTKPIRRKDSKTTATIVLVGSTPDGKYVVARSSTLREGVWITQQPKTQEQMEQMYENLPERKERWINFYNGYASTYHASPSRANSCRRETWMGTAKVVIEGDRVVEVKLVED